MRALQTRHPGLAFIEAAAASLASPLAGLFFGLAALATAVALAAPGLPVLRVGAIGYGCFALVAFAVPDPVGGNVSRLAQYLAGPLLVALVPGRRLADRKSTRLNSSHVSESRMPSSA